MGAVLRLLEQQLRAGQHAPALLQGPQQALTTGHAEGHPLPVSPRRLARGAAHPADAGAGGDAVDQQVGQRIERQIGVPLRRDGQGLFHEDAHGIERVIAERPALDVAQLLVEPQRLGLVGPGLEPRQAQALGHHARLQLAHQGAGGAAAALGGRHEQALDLGVPARTVLTAAIGAAAQQRVALEGAQEAGLRGLQRSGVDQEAALRRVQAQVVGVALRQQLEGARAEGVQHIDVHGVALPVMASR